MANRFKIPLLCVVSCFTVLLPSGMSPAEEKARRIGIILEGAFESPEIARNPPGGESTLMVPSYQWDYGIRAFSRKEWEKEQLTWERAIDLSRKLGDEILAETKPEFIRDDRGVIQYAILAAKTPFLSTVLFSDKFSPVFAETMGNSLYAVQIDRHVLYVFPSIGGTLEDYGPALVDEFRSTPLPVSLEVFLIDGTGLRVIGELSRDAPTE